MVGARGPAPIQDDRTSKAKNRPWGPVLAPGLGGGPHGLLPHCHLGVARSSRAKLSEPWPGQSFPSPRPTQSLVAWGWCHGVDLAVPVSTAKCRLAPIHASPSQQALPACFCGGSPGDTSVPPRGRSELQERGPGAPGVQAPQLWGVREPLLGPPSLLQPGSSPARPGPLPRNPHTPTLRPMATGYHERSSLSDAGRALGTGSQEGAVGNRRLCGGSVAAPL